MAGYLEALPNLPFSLVAEHLSTHDIVSLSGCSRTLHARRLELLRLLPVPARHGALADAVIRRAPEEVQLLLSARATREMVASNFCHLLRMCCEHHGLAVLRSLHEQGLVGKADLLWTRQLPDMSMMERVEEDREVGELMEALEYDQDHERGCFPLLAAAAAGDVEVLRFLTTAFELSDADYEGHTLRQAPLRAACFNNHVEVARYILAELGYCRRKPPRLRAFGPAASWATLCAVQRASHELVELLIEHKQLTADDFRPELFTSELTTRGILLHEAGEAGVDFLLWLLRRMEMTAVDLAERSPVEDWDLLLDRFVDEDDLAGDLPRWLDAVQADTVEDVLTLLHEFVDHTPIFAALLSLGRVTAEDVAAGGEDSLTTHAAVNSGEAVEMLMAPPFSVPRSTFREYGCAPLWMVLTAGDSARLTGLLGLTRDILVEEVRDEEVRLLTQMRSEPNGNPWGAEALAEARDALAAWDRGEGRGPPPLFDAADKPDVRAEVAQSLCCVYHDNIDLRSVRLLIRRLGATRGDLCNADVSRILATLLNRGSDAGSSAVVDAHVLVREGLLCAEDARGRAAELLSQGPITESPRVVPRSTFRALFGPLGLTAEHALLPLTVGEAPGGFLRRLAAAGNLPALFYVLTDLGLRREHIIESGCLEAAQASNAGGAEAVKNLILSVLEL